MRKVLFYLVIGAFCIATAEGAHHMQRKHLHHIRLQHPHIEPAPNNTIARIRETAQAARPALPPILEATVVLIDSIIESFKVTNPIEHPVIIDPVADAMAYLKKTSCPGYTMSVQSTEVALSCLNPDFALRLSAAIHDARKQGMNAGIMSACRPPILGVGGMRDKSQSMHAIGLAVDMCGITPLWNKIAEAHGIIKPYNAPWEWNHYQPTEIKVASEIPTAKKVLSAYGPTDLGKLWSAEARVLLPRDKPNKESDNGQHSERPRIHLAYRRVRVGNPTAVPRPVYIRPAYPQPLDRVARNRPASETTYR